MCRIGRWNGSITFSHGGDIYVADPRTGISKAIVTGPETDIAPVYSRDGTRILDSTDVLSLRVVPARTVIVGGGYIGVELGTALAKAGASVTIVEMAERLLPGLPSAVAGAAELDAVSALHRKAHRVEDGVHGHLGLDLGDVRDFRDFVDDVDLDHSVSGSVRDVTTIVSVSYAVNTSPKCGPDARGANFSAPRLVSPSDPR